MSQLERHHGAFVTASGAGNQLVLAADGAVTASPAERTISGIVVPYGKAGETSGGRLKFARGSLTWADPKRIKLLREHDQAGAVIGHGVSFTETDEGLFGVFNVPTGDAGDVALVEAANGLRDAFSVGVQLDDATLTRLRRAGGASVDAAGALREVSTVSVPAFDDARMAAHADLVVSTWTTTTTDPSTTTAGSAGTNREETAVNRRQRLAALRAQTTLSQSEATELAALAALPDSELDAPHEAGSIPAAPAPAEPATPAGTGAATAATGVTTGQPVGATASTTGPTRVPAVAGAAVVTSEPSTYNFAGDGFSIVTDLVNGFTGARDSEAAARVERFNAELRGANPASINAFMTAAATTTDVDGDGTDVSPALAPTPRPIFRDLVDKGRPFISRLETVPITNAQPFAVPGVEADFDGVGTHTEGTPHRPAGKLTLSGGGVVQPKAVSGAWEVSRELVDATNPAIDRVAARAMLRDYRRKSEGNLVSLLSVRALQGGASIYNVDDVMALRDALEDFVNDDEEGADLVALSKGLKRLLIQDVDGVDRPMLPFIGPVNALGTTKAGSTGLAIDGVEMFRAASLDAAANLGAASGILARSEGILWAESSVLQFRFDEVLGPGVIKLALWAYNGAALLDVDDVKILRAGADPTPGNPDD